MISVITPTHNPEHLDRVYESLLKQTCKDFEWVVVPNGDAAVMLPNEDWIRIEPFIEKSNLIGEIKNFAFNQGKGDWLLELDHDDELFPTAIESIIEHAGDNDFLYSDCWEVNEKGETINYNPEHGWKYEDFDGKKINKSWPVFPQMLSRIWYAPNHLRAWKADFYREIGGHDKTLKALDDQDLMCRTYIKGKMKQIPKVLYKYNFHSGNSFSSNELNQWIQDHTLEMHDKYITPLMERWCEINRLGKVDLCGGHNPPKGYTSVDILNGDVHWNLDIENWPFEDGSVGIVRASDALEHLKCPIKTMKEIHRILAPGGMLLSHTPSTDGRGAFQDPTHKSFWNSNSFWYYTRKETAAYINTPVRFQATRVKNYFPSEWHQQHNILYVEAHLTALKGGNEWEYCCGPIEI